MKKRKEIIEYSSGNTVTIDELLKDDPKALAELADLRKWMDENPGMFEFPEEKKTQGQKKLKQILEDARRNATFSKKVRQLAKAKPKYTSKHLEFLYAAYRKYLFLLATFRKEFLLSVKNYQLRRALCRDYGIDPVLLDRLVHAARNDRLEGWDFSEETSGDMCMVETKDDADLIEDIHNFHLTTVDQTDREVYPIKLSIHRFASKRDVLDFVDKQWNLISPYLEEKRIKERKLPREVLDFIWKHKNKKAKDIAELVSDKYPKHSLVYYEINKILSEEKKRRNVKKA